MHRAWGWFLLSVQLFIKVGGRSLTRNPWRRVHLPHATILRGIMLHKVYIPVEIGWFSPIPTLLHRVGYEIAGQLKTTG